MVNNFDDPLDALSHYKTEFYDLLLLDVRMPKMSGFVPYNEIRKSDAGDKVCFVPAFEIQKEELSKFFPDQDGRCVVKKPVSKKDLVRIINEKLRDDSANVIAGVK